MSDITLRRKVLNYFVTTLNGMALGLFATLIIGVIINQLGVLLGSQALIELYGILRTLMGVGIGIGVAWSLKLQGLSLISGAIAGGIATAVVADPVVAYLTTIIAIESVRFILKKKTPIDIILIPFVTSLIAFFIATLIGPPVAVFMQGIGTVIEEATTLQPFLMGIIVAVIMGMALTAPISSAAIAISIGLSGLAAGAALAGGAAQMIGFAIMSRKDNPIGTVLSIAVGTSMLQFKNVLIKPIIWLPPIIASAILGPLSTIVFKMQTSPIGAGMGTSGLVGPISTLEVMGYQASTFISIGFMYFVFPLVIVFLIDLLLRKKGLITLGDFDLTTH